MKKYLIYVIVIVAIAIGAYIIVDSIIESKPQAGANTIITEPSVAITEPTATIVEPKPNAAELYRRGLAFEQGRGVQKDYQEAAYWLLQAATEKQACAAHDLGRLYVFGFGVEKNRETAQSWFNKSLLWAKDLNDSEINRLIKEYQGDFDKLAHYYAVDQSYQQAMPGIDPGTLLITADLEKRLQKICWGAKK